MELAVLPGAGQGEHVVPAGLAVGRADALGNAPIIESESAVHVSALAEAHGAHVASFAALARARHEFRAGVDHELVGVLGVPRVEIDRAAFRVHDAVEALIAQVNAAEKEGVPFGLDEVAGDGGIPGGEVGMKEVRTNHTEGHRFPTWQGRRGGHGQRQDAAGVGQAGPGAGCLIPFAGRRFEDGDEVVMVIGHGSGLRNALPVLVDRGISHTPGRTFRLRWCGVPLGLGGQWKQAKEGEKKVDSETVGHDHTTR